MDIVEILGLMVGLAFVAAMVAFALWYSARGRAHLYRRIEAVDELLRQRAARASGFHYEPAKAYAHPMLGRIPAAGSLLGVHAGVEMRLHVGNFHGSSQHPHYALGATVRPAGGATFDPARRDDVAGLLHRAGCKLGTLDAREMFLYVLGSYRLARFGQRFDLPEDHDALARFIDTAARAAHEALRGA